MKLDIDVEDADKLMVLHQGWVEGKPADDDSAIESFDLTCGAGLGHPHMIVTVKLKDGRRVRESFSVSQLLSQWLLDIEARHA